MKENSTYLITVRFPGWVEGDHTFSPYGYKYLFTTQIVQFPDWPENDDRWATWSEQKVVRDRFAHWYKQKVQYDFNGEILFIEPADNIIVADGLAPLV